MRPTKLTKIRQYVTLLTHLQCIETLSGYHSQAIVLMWFLLQLYSRLSLKRCFSQPCGFYCMPHVAAFNMPRSLVSASIPSLSHVINYSVIDPVMFHRWQLLLTPQSHLHVRWALILYRRDQTLRGFHVRPNSTKSFSEDGGSQPHPN